MAKWPLALKVGALLVSLVIAGALLSYVWLPHNPDETDFLKRLQPPSSEHLLGTDHFGRDLLARILVGARSALWVGMVAVSIGLGCGLVFGLWSGYTGGWLDRIIMFVLDAVYSVPAILLALLLAAAWGPGATGAMVAVGIWAVPVFARLARASTLSIKAQPFVEASWALGASHLRVMRREVLPNILAPLIIQASLIMAVAILVEAALSYLGLGVQPPTASWGRMLRDAQGFMQFSPYPMLVPGVAIMLTVLGFNQLGDGLRDYLDPHSRNRK